MGHKGARGKERGRKVRFLKITKGASHFSEKERL